MGNMARILGTLAICILALLAAPLSASPEPPPLSAYGALPEVEDVALSPSGDRIATLTTFSQERVLLILDREGSVLRLVKVGDAKLRSMQWAGDEWLILQTGQTQDLGFGFTTDKYEAVLASVVPAGPQGDVQTVFTNQRDMVTSIFGSYGIRQVDGRWKAYVGGLELKRGLGAQRHLGTTSPSLIEVDISSKETKRADGPAADGEDKSWLLGPDGKVAASFETLSGNGSWRIRGSGGSLLVKGVAPEGDAGLVALGPDGTSVIYSEEDQEAEITRWYEVPLDGSGAPREYLANENVERLYVDPFSGRLLGFLRRGPEGGPVFFDPARQEIANKVHQAFGGLDMTLVDWTPDFSTILVRTSGNEDSGTWYIIDVRQLRAEAIAYERPRILPEQVGPVSTFAYKAGDGLDLDGILTLPPGQEPKNLPLVMLPHGGPHSHDEEAFDWWAQAFASRGYAVFQPNFRGSINRDEEFIRAGYRQWGRKMQTDISDGLAALGRKGIVDPKRACIVGASYGGYAALAGVTLQNGLYRCAVAVAPVSDVELMYETDYWDSAGDQRVRRSLVERLGPKGELEAVSPRRFAAKADAPILLIHGRDDTVVPFNQSTKMADALRKAEKPYKLVELSEEDHWLSRSATRMQMLSEAMAFVQEHNPAD